MIKNYPTQEELHTRYEYKEGKLYHKPQEGQAMFNGKYAGKQVGSQHNSMRLKTTINGKKYYIARMIYIMHHGDISNEMYVDHANQDAMDDRIENLRLVTPSENSLNYSHHRTWVGKTHTEETKQKMRAKASNRNRDSLGLFLSTTA